MLGVILLMDEDVPDFLFIKQPDQACVTDDK